MQFVVDATSRNCKGNLWLCYAPFAFTFIVSLSYKIFERMTLLPVSTQALASQTTLFFFKRIYTYHSVQFQCVRAAHSRVGKDRARPTQVFHLLGVVRTLMTMGVYDLRCEQNKECRAMKTIH